MSKNTSRKNPSDGARTPGSAEGERDPVEQNDRADEEMVNQADDEDDDFDEDEDEDEDDEEADEDEEEAP
jgi:hypothetical protein